MLCRPAVAHSIKHSRSIYSALHIPVCATYAVYTALQSHTEYVTYECQTPVGTSDLASACIMKIQHLKPCTTGANIRTQGSTLLSRQCGRTPFSRREREGGIFKEVE